MTEEMNLLLGIHARSAVKAIGTCITCYDIANSNADARRDFSVPTVA